ncbi:hypothetical protein HWV62_9901 [Athelia sp. TMB]|nr:hypothetical protein HWV62_9901 [Athelia sp. TMB]
MSDAPVLKVSILGNESIHCGFHLTPYIARTVVATLPASAYVLVTDTHVAALHLPAFESAFAAALAAHGAPARFLSHVVPPGETSKSRAGKAQIEDFLLRSRCTRDTVVLALGGGVIGDLTGFVAATFMRGVRFVQIPTTLLAMVDSSVGGKTAIDTPHGKNLIGAFWQPEYVFIDAAFLATLPAREFANGMAEVVKTAAIWSADEFALLESRAAEIRAAASTPVSSTRSAAHELLLRLIHGSIRVKAHIVTLDERETGLRNLVNFGHTLGHALEAVLTPAILHGECVGVGMVLEAEVARARGVLGQVAVGRLTRCLNAYDLPVSMDDPRIKAVPAAKNLSVARLLDIMALDKKNSGPAKKIVLLSRIGATHEPKATTVADSVIATVLSAAVRVIPGAPRHDPVRMRTPGSKSVSNRALVLAALGGGTCRLRGLLHSDDTQVMMNALVELKGATFAWEDNGETLVVTGGRGALAPPAAGKEIYLGNAGTAARFLTTVCTLASSSSSSSPPSSSSSPSAASPSAASSSPSAPKTVLTGNARMKQRPIGPLVAALTTNGAAISYLETPGCLPLAISPLGLQGGRVQLAASVSSQYVSSLLLCAPYAREPLRLELVGGAVVSQPYIDMTLAMMRAFGIEVVRGVDPATGAPLDVYEVPRGTYTNPEVYEIESDASSATYPLALAAITGTSCTIESIGSGSLQGDARFAVEVLRRMGCDVEQGETETTVKGPGKGGLRALGEIDMESMTDAFLTASVLAAVAVGGGGVTRIRGIANQRVKECDRIRAMMDQLAKFGVETKELDDGLEIHGKPIEELKTGVSVHCYDDHRVAMAFSVLGAVVPGTVLEEKRCVEKTWPNWWDDLANKIGIDVEGVDLAAAEPAPAPASADAGGSIVLIGMRGSGKTFIGTLAAAVLGWAFVDADAHFEATLQTGVREYVAQHGWPAFRAAETQILQDLLAQCPARHVISLGGGIVETPAAREALTAWARAGRVVHVVRELEEVVRYLEGETARPAYGEPVADVFRRREPWFAACANYEFVNQPGLEGGDAPRAPNTREIARFFRHLAGQPNRARNLAPGRRSYFLSLTYPDVAPALAHIDELTAGADAVELRVDLLRSPRDFDKFGAYVPPAAYVASQVAALRRATALPIVYTVRTVAQGGSFPDDAEQEAFELLGLAVRMGVEYIDVEITWPEQRLAELAARKGASQLIASWHEWSGTMKWGETLVQEKYELASRFGDIVKIIGKANTFADNFALFDFVSRMGALEGAKPLIAINMGVEGQMTRILNSTFTPISHPLLPSKAAPGQLSFIEIQKALHLLGLLPARRFFLFGSTISQSPSPTLHNTAFQALALPHVYDLLQTADVGEEIKATIVSADFGGASVTLPFKLDIIPLLDKLSPAAEAIGAVNTVIPLATDGSESERILYGDNTDWIGIRECIRARLPPSNRVPAALVIGAGGTARAAVYAMKALGAGRIYLFNRTRSRAEELAEAFPDLHIDIVDELGHWPEGGPSPSVIVSTLPPSATTLDRGEEGAVYLPVSLFDPDHQGVVLDAAYKPAETPLLTLAKTSAKGWATAQGLDMLLEQGYEQFELWTGRKCPRGVVAKKVWEYYEA